MGGEGERREERRRKGGEEGGEGGGGCVGVKREGCEGGKGGLFCFSRVRTENLFLLCSPCVSTDLCAFLVSVVVEDDEVEPAEKYWRAEDFVAKASVVYLFSSTRHLYSARHSIFNDNNAEGYYRCAFAQ